MRRRRLTTWAKWACTVAAVAVIGLAGLSGFWACTFRLDYQRGDKTLLVGARTGLACMVIISWSTPLWSPVGPTLKMQREAGWDWGVRRGAGLDHWRFGFMFASGRDEWGAGISLVYPVVIAAVPASLLWCTDGRRFGAGRCGKCGYDRRGIAAGVKCPECGTVVARR